MLEVAAQDLVAELLAVLARADDGERRSVDLSEGDKVLFGKFAGTEVTYDGTEYLIMREDDILAII